MTLIHNRNFARLLPSTSFILGALMIVGMEFLSVTTPAHAAPELSAVAERRRVRNPIFVCPPELRPRVDFWLDIFTRYGKHQSVIHHREYPQAVFGVLDFRREAEELSPIALEKHRKQRIESAISQVVGIIKRIESGDEPSTEAERRVIEVMKRVPGRNKYARIIENPELIRSQTGIREKCAEAIQRSGLYLPEIERIFVREFGLPVELTRLPFIESSFDYRAYSSVGAAGIWQFMPKTGKQFLTINRLVDERRDPIIASYAAARYLQGGFEALGSWPLAITAYNHGRAGVARKVRDFGTSDIVKLIERPGDKPFGFASSNFYPEFLAALDVFDNPQQYFPEVKIPAPVEVDRIPLQIAMPITQVARKLDVSVAELRQVNFALADAVWDGRAAVPRGYVVKVPRGGATVLADLHEPELVAPRPPPPARQQYAAAYHRVRKGETLASIASRYGTSIAELKRINQISGDSIRIGQQLAVAESGMVREAEAPRRPGAQRVTYVVRSGDTLHGIAKRFGVSVAHIRELNRLQSAKIRVGQSLVMDPKRSSVGEQRP